MRILLFCLLTAFVSGCAGQRSPADTPEAKPEEKTKDLQTTQPASKAEKKYFQEPKTTPSGMAQGPDGEMIPNILKISKGVRTEGAKSSLPKGRSGLMRAAGEAMEKGRFDEAAAISDTLVIIYPDDPEILELRASLLSRTGDEEQANLDLARCCKLGRPSCCRNADKDRDASY
jgi:Flp pilus assembly protein TadD